MKILFNLFPGGRSKALTLSYDDGTIHDRRMVDILNAYHLKGSFHLNSGLFGQPNYISLDEVQSLYSGHEVSAHTVSHPFLDITPRERIIMEIMEDRRALELLVGYPVRGMSYPYGSYHTEIVDMLPALGIQYSRTTISTGRFDMPENPLLWNPTCHHKDMLQLGDSFLKLQRPSWNRRMSLLYVWGHSYEFENDSNWDQLEAFCRLLSGQEDIWYATNIEIVDYMLALKRLQFSVDGTIVFNPNASSVWISVDGHSIEIRSGQTTRLDKF